MSTPDESNSERGLIPNFIKYKQFEMSVCDAAAHFNVGNLATLLIFDELKVERD